MKYTIATSVGALASCWLTGVDAFWRMNCGIAQIGRVDPVINPNAISGHVHLLSGASSE